MCIVIIIIQLLSGGKNCMFIRSPEDCVDQMVFCFFGNKRGKNNSEVFRTKINVFPKRTVCVPNRFVFTEVTRRLNNIKNSNTQHHGHRYTTDYL